MPDYEDLQTAARRVDRATRQLLHASPAMLEDGGVAVEYLAATEALDDLRQVLRSAGDEKPKRQRKAEPEAVEA